MTEREACFIVSEAQMDSIVDSIAAPLLDDECRRVAEQVLEAAAACGVVLVPHEATWGTADDERVAEAARLIIHGYEQRGEGMDLEEATEVARLASIPFVRSADDTTTDFDKAAGDARSGSAGRGAGPASTFGTAEREGR